MFERIGGFSPPNHKLLSYASFATFDTSLLVLNLIESNHNPLDTDKCAPKAKGRGLWSEDRPVGNPSIQAAAPMIEARETLSSTRI